MENAFADVKVDHVERPALAEDNVSLRVFGADVFHAVRYNHRIRRVEPGVGQGDELIKLYDLGGGTCADAKAEVIDPQPFRVADPPHAEQVQVMLSWQPDVADDPLLAFGKGRQLI